MAQIVIFAPSGEDVSAGEEALKQAGHDVEVVEATATNLLHMAVGMLDNGDSSEELPAEEPAEELPAEEPAEELPAEEAPTTEAVGQVVVDGETLPAYLDTTLSMPLLRLVNLAGDRKITAKLHENAYTFWRDNGCINATMELSAKHRQVCEVQIERAVSRNHIILDNNTAKRLGLV